MKTSKPARWFRLYAEFATDPKVQMLSETEQRRYIMLLCLRCSNGDVTLHDDEVAFQLRISTEEWLSTKQSLLSKCLITADSKPTAWDKRQFASDSSAERVAAHRERVKQSCNVTVTPPETETETETEKVKNTAQPSGFAEFWLAFPRKKNKGDAEKAWKAIKPGAGLVATILAAIASAKQSVEWLKDGGRFIPYPASWLRAKGWEDVIEVRAYNAGALALMEQYNREMVPHGWPEAVAEPYSEKRAAAITEFIGLRSREGWISAYIEWMAQNVPHRDGFGFDWLIQPQTVVRAREGNFAGVAA